MCSKVGTVIRDFFKSITVEPAYLTFAISQGLYIIVASELYISKVCKVNLALGDEICDNIQQHKEEQVQVGEVSNKAKLTLIRQHFTGSEVCVHPENLQQHFAICSISALCTICWSLE